ncbi:hypothetical protein AS180_14645 [Priestia veravalensis]|uniref:Phospholipase D-like domain-containing protein n=1 Tax=Priestia veravalensis TaxID=1414648 RepID=A0A0V8JJC1_9BACI|nr:MULTISPECIES: phospholipase D family protein [Priestia]KSU87141.1 hypothetical protein AS180_14645 [Priestia veravalensis]SCC42023.1 hypothetical protein GA0061087_10413 [Priestia flexa]
MAFLQKKTQGITGDWNYRKELMAMLSEEKYENFTFATAFASENGVNLLEEQLVKVGKNVTVFVGVRNGVTTYQAIIKLLSLGVKVFGVDTGSAAKIFHEKTYTGSNSDEAIVVTGSGNLTRGGLVANIESGTLIKCDLTNINDEGYYQQCMEQLNILVHDYHRNVYQINDVVMAGELLANGILIDEKKAKPRTVKGTSKANLASIEIPPMKTFVEKTGIQKSEKVAETEGNYLLAVPDETNSEFNVLNFEKIWRSKELTERDLNIPTNAGTNTTGSMLLKKGAYDINQQSYFYEEAFKELTWTPGAGNKDKFLYAEAHFDFLIDGVFIKGHELVLKHDPRTNTKTYLQKQPMTHLLWGAAKPLVAKRHLLEEIMTIYKDQNNPGKYLIKIEAEE